MPIHVKKAEISSPLLHSSVKSEAPYHLEPHTGEFIRKAYSPFINPDTGTWFCYDEDNKVFFDTKVPAKGEKGDKGDQGDRGADGLDGKNGADGKDGRNGLDGRNGRDGLDGRDGYTPVKGIDYFDGRNGKDGKDGVNGLDGKDGVNGTNGKDGYTPVKNIDYFDGKDGKDGKDYVITENDYEIIADIAKDKIDLSPYLTEETDPTVPAWAKEENKPDYAESELKPILSKTYTEVWNNSTNKSSNNSTTYTEWFIGGIHTTKNEPWKLRYKLTSFMPNWTKQKIADYGLSGTLTVNGEDQAFGACWAIVELKGIGNKVSNSVVDSQQFNTSYRSQYYSPYAYPSAIVEDPFIYIGYGIYGGYQYYLNNATNFDKYKDIFGRTVKVEILSTEGCTCELYEKDNWINYSTPSGYTATNLGVTTQGRTQTGDINQVDRYCQYFYVTSGQYGILGYTLHMFTGANKLEPLVQTRGTGTTKKANAAGFDISRGLWHINSSTATVVAANTSGTIASTYRAITTFDSRYSFNNTTNVKNGQRLFIVGTINADDGLFYLDTTQWYAGALPTTNDGKVYIEVGTMYSSNYNCVMLMLHPVYKHNGTMVECIGQI